MGVENKVVSTKCLICGGRASAGKPYLEQFVAVGYHCWTCRHKTYKALGGEGKYSLSRWLTRAAVAQHELEKDISPEQPAIKEEEISVGELNRVAQAKQEEFLEWARDTARHYGAHKIELTPLTVRENGWSYAEGFGVFEGAKDFVAQLQGRGAGVFEIGQVVKHTYNKPHGSRVQFRCGRDIVGGNYS